MHLYYEDLSCTKTDKEAPLPTMRWDICQDAHNVNRHGTIALRAECRGNDGLPTEELNALEPTVCLSSGMPNKRDLLTIKKAHRKGPMTPEPLGFMGFSLFFCGVVPGLLGSNYKVKKTHVLLQLNSNVGAIGHMSAEKECKGCQLNDHLITTT